MLGKRYAAWLRAASVMALCLPLAAYLWFWMLHGEEYFPDKYETALSALGFASLVAVIGIFVLIWLWLDRREGDQ
jgi:hypothetical protein